jgi:hypothetical protein
MKRPAVDDPQSKDKAPTTMVAHLGPTVVVRRRIVEAPSILKTHSASEETQDEEEESGPPSSVNVARALASLRADELTRLEQIMSDDEDAELAAPPPPTPARPAIPTLRLGLTVGVADLARQLGIPSEELVTACVTNGFFSVTVKSVLPRETARTVASTFGFQTEEDDSIESAPIRSPRPPKVSTAGAAGKTKSPKKKTAKR